MSKAAFRRFNQRFGYVHDERIEQVQGRGNRNSFWFRVVFLLPFAFFQQFVNGNPAAFWFVGTAVCLALVYLGWQRRHFLQFDERAQALMLKSYFFANLMVVGILILYFVWLPLRLGGFGGLNDLQGFYLWGPAMMITILPILLTHAKENSTGQRGLQLVLSLLILVLFGFFLLVYVLG